MTINPKNAFFIIFYFFVMATISHAEVHLSVNPTDGSNSLRFERFSSTMVNQKGLRIRVTSTEGKSYQIFQKILEPLVNEKGETLDLKAIEISTEYNSNASGTLYLNNADRLSYGEQLIYTSGQGGEGDSFVIDYKIHPDELSEGGNFSGKLVFTVRVMGESKLDQAVMDVQIESADTWAVSVKGGRSPERVILKDSDTSEKAADFITIAFSGNNGQEVRIYQEVESLPQSTTAREISSDLIWFSVTGEDPKNMRVQEPSKLVRNREILYSGDKSEDNVMVSFWMDADRVMEQDAGTYVGKVKYIIERYDHQDELPIELECIIQPIFSIQVDLPPGGVSFTNVLPTNPPQEKEVLVTVKTNLNQPYQVTQIMSSPMTNESGKEISKEYLHLKVEIPEGQKGQTKYSDFSSMDKGEYPIFLSDLQGNPATFKVIYRLQGSAQLSSGNFLAPVKFSLNQN